MHDPLSALAELERRHDGPIPPEARLAARLGSSAAALGAKAAGEAHFFTTLARGQIEAIRRARNSCRPEGRLRDTLALYLAERRRFRRIARNPASVPSDPPC
jgi:hypothetical protein